jgi:hypothetical protein
MGDADRPVGRRNREGPSQVRREAGRTPFDVYQELDLGTGGYAVAPSTATRRGVRQALRRKLRR